MNKTMVDNLPVSQSQYKRLLDSREKFLIAIVVVHPHIKLLNVSTYVYVQSIHPGKKGYTSPTGFMTC